jgi:hypothetical protein
MLIRMRLLNIALGHLLHHKVGIDIDLLTQLAVRNAPLSRDGKHADRGLSVDEGIDS